MRLAILVLVLSVTVAACGDTSRPGGGSRDTSSQCENASAIARDIATGLTVTGGGTLRGAQAVKSNDHASVWFVAAEIDGPGLEGSGDIGIWATGGTGTGDGPVYAVDAVAREFSDWGSRYSSSDEDARAAEDCVRS